MLVLRVGEEGLRGDVQDRLLRFDHSVRSALELLGAAYAVHPAFAEARIVEFGSGLRPAYPDNLPRIAIDKENIAVNGLYRHGFLLAPALAELVLGYVERGVIDNEVMQCA